MSAGSWTRAPEVGSWDLTVACADAGDLFGECIPACGSLHKEQCILEEGSAGFDLLSLQSQTSMSKTKTLFSLVLVLSMTSFCTSITDDSG